VGEDDILGYSPPDTTLALEGVHVLLVEDVDDARDMLALILEMYGADVVSTSSAYAALDALESQSFQILVSDIGLPGMNGYALIRRIRAHEHERGGFLPAIAVTAYTSDADRCEALSAGFQSHAPKPLVVEDLVSIMSVLAKAA
jgi:CheY-like chemotaxis protein